MADSPETRGRIPLPLALVTLALFFGAMKIQGFRPYGARALVIMLPLGVTWAGVVKLRDAHALLRRIGLVLGVLIVLLCELLVLHVFFGVSGFALGPSLVAVTAGVFGLGSLALEAVAARRSLRVRVSAWLGIALGFAVYLASVAPPLPDKEFGLAFVASLVGLWGGGLAGLTLGALVARLVQAPPPAPTASPVKPN
jgi:hypothetical protein